jgi:hypothetical protein
MVRASDCQCNNCHDPGFDPSIRRHSGILEAADEAMLNTILKKIQKISPLKKITEQFLNLIAKLFCFFFVIWPWGRTEQYEKTKTKSLDRFRGEKSIPGIK